MTFIDKVYSICYRKHIRPSQFLSELGYTPQRVSNWRYRGTIPSSEHVNRIAEALGVTPDRLIPENNANDNLLDVYEDDSVPPVDEKITDYEYNIIHMMRLLSKKDRIYLEGFLDCFFKMKIK